VSEGERERERREREGDGRGCVDKQREWEREEGGAKDTCSLPP